MPALDLAPGESDRIIVLAPGGVIHEEIPVDLPRPRRLSDKTVATAQSEVLSRLEALSASPSRPAPADPCPEEPLAVKPKLFVPQPIPDVALTRLRQRCEVTVYPHLDRRITRDELLDAVRDQQILYALGEVEYDEAVLDTASQLRLVAAMHVAATFVDIAAATRRGIPVTGIPNTGLSRTTAEFTFALILSTAWRLPEADRFLREDRWTQNQSEAFVGSRVYGTTLGIVGLGAVGTGVAVRARACGMRLLYTKRSPLSPAEEAGLGVEYRTLADLFRESDFVVLTPALTKDTDGLVTADLIATMKPDAVLINTSRGAVLDEAALEEALAAGRIRGAGLDVFRHETNTSEPTGPSPRMRELPNVVLTPHMGSAARQTRDEMALRTVENIERFLDGERPLDVLNPEVYGEAARRTEVIG